MSSTSYLTQYDLSEFENIGAIGLELWQVTGFIFITQILARYGERPFPQDPGRLRQGDPKFQPTLAYKARPTQPN